MSRNMIEAAAFAMADELTEIRKDLHRIPELGKNEIRTSEYIKSKLSEYGISYRVVYNTGIVCVIRGEKTGNAGIVGNGKNAGVLLRADMDALPVEEESGEDFSSQIRGCMHACGHDVHMTCLLGAVKILNDMRGELCGNITAVFQPNEELEGGALPMIEDGVMNTPRVSAAFALHVEPLEKVGNIQVRDGAVMASPDDFEITINGVGGHGAYPEKCINPIEVATRIIERYKSEIENDPDLRAVSICSVNAGNCRNAIPPTAVMTGTARSLDRDERRALEEKLRRIAEEAAADMGARAVFDFNKLFPPVINDKAMNDVVRAAARKLKCVNKVVTLERASMAGDDFAYFAEIVPSAYFKLGVGNEEIGAVYPIHNPKFKADNNALPIGAAMMAQIAAE
ncbi:MAG: M20 family metallopeptidase, partial [Firmicutes bacterium]|nr:M20 family metallopeptidase [Bacillota bacterium]